jgi:ribonucleoside-diphosphate reductase beta chain
MEGDRTGAALSRMAAEDPELAARLVLMTLPAAAARIKDPLTYDLELDGLGSWRVSTGNPPSRGAGGGARMEPAAGLDGGADFKLITDARGLAELAGGAGPLRLLLGRRLRLAGKRRKALALRQMGGDPPSMAEVAQAGVFLDPDVMFRALPYLVDPEWTRGHRFVVRYELTGDGGGSWYVEARDGQPLRVSAEAPAQDGVSATARIGIDAYQRMSSGELTPAEAMQNQLTEIEGEIHPVTLLGRWIDRAQGRDDEELAREERQRELQQARAGRFEGGAGGDGQQLLDYSQLYALWERQNWRATDLDFTVDREQWLTTPTEAQLNTIWSLGSFYVGEERVTADLAPFLGAAPSGEVELFLATQLVDEARHAAFFDRFGAEVMALSADDLRGRMREVQDTLMKPWYDVFDGGLRDVARRIQAKPDDLDLFVEGIATYHMVIEGFLAVTGQTLIRDYMLEHGLYPGFCEGFGLVERDEHRHVAFGVRFLRDAIAEDPRHRATVERVVLELAPRSAHVFCPPYVDDPREFVSYGYHSSEIYGRAYRTLKRRMKVLGIEIPPPEELMPGPIAEPSVA